jgi:hypothetical protein
MKLIEREKVTLYLDKADKEFLVFQKLTPWRCKRGIHHKFHYDFKKFENLMSKMISMVTIE